MYAATPPQLLVFELWVGDELVAADFGHPTAHNKRFGAIASLLVSSLFVLF
jgi:hypothetical protein